MFKGSYEYQCIQKICQILISSYKPGTIFSHCFLTLAWYLMERANNCVNYHGNNIKWRGGSMIILFSHYIWYQEGVNRIMPWNIDSSPIVSEICPVVAIDKDVFAYPALLKGGSNIFQGIHNTIVL